MFEAYRVQVKDYWGFWVDVATFYSEDRARRFVDALKRDYPKDEFRIVKEVIKMDTGIVIAAIAGLALLPLALLGLNMLTGQRREQT
jgi:hypothetical protein